jgi:hypothetical protein
VKDGAESAFGHVSWVVRKRYLLSRLGVSPDFVTPRAGAVKGEAAGAKLVRNLAVFETREPAHLRHSNGDA